VYPHSITRKFDCARFYNFWFCFSPSLLLPSQHKPFFKKESFTKESCIFSKGFCGAKKFANTASKPGGVGVGVGVDVGTAVNISTVFSSVCPSPSSAAFTKYIMLLVNIFYLYNLIVFILSKWLIFLVNNIVLCVIAILAMNASLNSIISPFFSKSAKISPANFDAASVIWRTESRLNSLSTERMFVFLLFVL